MMEVVRTSETSVDNHFTRQYIPEDNSEQDTSIYILFFTKYGMDIVPLEATQSLIFIFAATKT
jgi:hypothetical protein